MTDNEIIVPLKCLVMNESDCRHCKLKDKNDKCQKFLYSDVLGLIEENNRQKAEIERLKAFKSYFDNLYGEGLDIANWHKNGDLEPFDSFYGSALEEMAGEGNV